MCIRGGGSEVAIRFLSQPLASLHSEMSVLSLPELLSFPA